MEHDWIPPGLHMFSNQIRLGTSTMSFPVYSLQALLAVIQQASVAAERDLVSLLPLYILKARIYRGGI
jgi:hypothetical protein